METNLQKKKRLKPNFYQKQSSFQLQLNQVKRGSAKANGNLEEILALAGLIKSIQFQSTAFNSIPRKAETSALASVFSSNLQRSLSLAYSA
ncbi:MAG: hypothetical protein ACK5NT_15065 [Pyrinomonadaceae bacterium]